MSNNDETLNEAMTPAEQAKQLGLTYGGFGGWVDNTRKVVARTVDGKLVRVSDDGGQGKQELGTLVVLNFPADLPHANKKGISPRIVEKFNQLLKGILKFEGTFVVFTPRNGERDVALYLKSVGITSNVKLVPYGSSDPNKKREYLEKKIKAGFRDIKFFDQDRKAVAAAESLKAPFNKLNLNMETHILPPLSKNTPQVASSTDGEQIAKAA